jgi:hypothetical protein
MREGSLRLRSLPQLKQQGEIRAFWGRLSWEGDLEAQRLDPGLAFGDPEHGERR